MKKDYTEFGKYFSKLRKERSQTITDAAKLLGVSIAYISSVEHGDRDIPSGWINKIIKMYDLNEKEQIELRNSYYDTPSLKRISIQDVENCMRNMIENNFEGEERKKLLIDLKKRINELRKN